MQAVDLAAIRAAAQSLEGVTWRTPVERSTSLERLVGGPVWLKCENLQRTGSFKLRGAYRRLSRLNAEERARGVVAASAGNHAQGVALAARLLGISAIVYMPEDAALPKLAATREYGATVRQHAGDLAGTLHAAQTDAEESGRIFIHPFDHADIVAGQGTIGLEILEQVPDVRTLVVPAGGGGMLAGVATAVRESRDDVRVVGVQAEGAAAFPASLDEGRPVPLSRMSTMADGIAVAQPGAIPLALVRSYVEDVRTVSEEQLARSILLLTERAKLTVEPAGAVGVAALLDTPEAFEPPVVVVLSGGNIDPILLLRFLRHGLAAAGRYLQMRVRLPDHPGSLAGLLASLAATGGNVVSVDHGRTAVDLHVDEVEIGVELETKGPDHCAEVLAALRSHGYGVTASHYGGG